MIIGQTTTFVQTMTRQAMPCQTSGQGGIAIDATAGRGLDTLFLAELAGESGHVYGFDIQKKALHAALARLAKAGLDHRTTLLHAGHETMGTALPESVRGRVDAIMFNLGYLPGTDESIVTRGETTCTAIDAGLGLLRPGGMLSLVIYTGHPGGLEEAEAVERHCASIPTRVAQVLRCTMHNHEAPKVRVVLMEKRKSQPNTSGGA